MSDWGKGLVAAALLLGAGVPPDRAVEAPGLVVQVDLSARRLEVLIDGERHARYSVAVGMPGHRTPPGTYALSRVVWNPSWVPPDRRWARGKKPKAPGERGNPMGRVKINFSNLLYIHGTNAPGTLGRPVSHGCIRMRNEDAMALARLVMEHGGAGREEAWYAETRERTRTTREVAIPSPPVLRIVR